MTHPEYVIAVKGLTKTFGNGDHVVRALDGVSFAIERGDYVAIVGTSGSGKSTLMNLLGCLDAPTSGHYVLDGLDVSQLDDEEQAQVRNERIGFVFQGFNLLRRTSALRNVEVPLVYRGDRRAERRAAAAAVLTAVGLADRLDHQPSQLSGGQQQRVAIARALVTNPALLLADEPTGNLDSASTADILDLFDALYRRGRTLVTITHEVDVAARAGRVIELRDGRIVRDARNRPLGSVA